MWLPLPPPRERKIFWWTQSCNAAKNIHLFSLHWWGLVKKNHPTTPLFLLTRILTGKSCRPTNVYMPNEFLGISSRQEVSNGQVKGIYFSSITQLYYLIFWLAIWRLAAIQIFQMPAQDYKANVIATSLYATGSIIIVLSCTHLYFKKQEKRLMV